MIKLVASDLDGTIIDKDNLKADIEYNGYYYFISWEYRKNTVKVEKVNSKLEILSSISFTGNKLVDCFVENEKIIVRLENEIAMMGANIINIPKDKELSQHASSEDLMLMINLMNPKYYMPVIGEYRHMVANKNVAKGFLLSLSNKAFNSA